VTTTPELRPTRLAALGARRPLLVDALIIAVIVGLGTLPDPGRAEGAEGRLLTLALALPLLGRRRRPVAVFCVIALTALAQWALGVRAFGDSALLVALYTVAATRPLPIALATAAVLEVGVGLAVLRWAGDHWLQGFIGLSGLTTAALVLGINARHRRALVASLHERAERLEYERDQQGRLSAAAERARIAREMHDIVAHNLSVLIALADGASYAVRDAPERAEAAMQTASRTGREALSEMRRLLGVLRDEPAAGARAPQPGLAQIDALIEDVRAAGLAVTHSTCGRPMADAPAGLQLAAYRIVQEALTNTLKHAAPGADAAVDLRRESDRLVIDVRDSGPPTGRPGPEGGGLRGMRERAAVYDGAVSAGPAPDGGWQVRAELVLDGAPAPGAPATA
jgi:YD repeat-containing protein